MKEAVAGEVKEAVEEEAVAEMEVEVKMEKKV